MTQGLDSGVKHVLSVSFSTGPFPIRVDRPSDCTSLESSVSISMQQMFPHVSSPPPSTPHSPLPPLDRERWRSLLRLTHSAVSPFLGHTIAWDPGDREGERHRLMCRPYVGETHSDQWQRPWVKTQGGSDTREQRQLVSALLRFLESLMTHLSMNTLQDPGSSVNAWAIKTLMEGD